MLQKKVRVLVVEDIAMGSEMIQGILEDMGHIVAGEAKNGRQAVELTQSLRPDVILMDIEMPADMDGIETMRRIQECCPTPVVVLTVYETPKLVEQVSAVGAGAYLVKPPNAREIESAIAIAMARFDDMIKLRRLNTQLEAQNAELDAFAHTVAHDLRNPLSSIIGFSSMLKSEFFEMSDEKRRDFLHRIEQNGFKMSNIIDKLLLLTRVRKMEVAMEPLDMASIVAKAQERLAYMIEEHQAGIILPDTWPVVLGYGPWVEEVWVNYISNALKYGGRPPRVELGADVGQIGNLSNNMVRFWVCDNGPGLTPREQGRLFTPFEQLDQVGAKGHGLGLSIVRRIVEKLGGEVGVENAAGVGSVFWFILPA